MKDKIMASKGDILAPPHEQIMFILGGLKTSVENLEKRAEQMATKSDVVALTEQVKKQNGNVNETMKRIGSLEETRTFHNGEKRMFSETWQVLVAILGGGGVLWGIIAIVNIFKK